MIETIKNEIRRLYPTTARRVEGIYKVECSPEVYEEVRNDFSALIEKEGLITFTVGEKIEEPVNKFSRYQFPDIGTITFYPTLDAGYKLQELGSGFVSKPAIKQ